MPNKPSTPKIGSPERGADTGLAMKDSLREVRFNMKRGARKLVSAVEAATQRHEAASHSPFGLLGEPLNLAVRTTANLLSSVDHAAVDLLSSDRRYRAMGVQLRSSVAYFSGPEASRDLKAFTTDHYWRYRHWLAMNQRSDVFVHEQAIAIAGATVAAADTAADRAAAFESSNDGPADDDLRRRTAVLVIRALQGQRILSKPTLLSDENEAELDDLCALGAVATVLAGEIAAGLGNLNAREQFAAALRLADEIAVADRIGWEGALRSLTPERAMGRWIDFVLRHV